MPFCGLDFGGKHNLPKLSQAKWSSIQIDFASDELLAYGCDGTISLWSIPENIEIKQLSYGAQSLYALEFSPDRQKLAFANWAGAQSGHGPVQIYDLEKGEITLVGSNSGVSVSFHPSGKILAYAEGGWNSTLKLYNLENGQRSYLPNHGNISQGLAFSPDGTLTVYGSRDGYIRVINTDLGTEIASIQKPEFYSDSSDNSIDFHPTQMQLAFTTWKHIHMWNLKKDTLESFSTYDETTKEGYIWGYGKRMLFNSDGTLLLMVSNSTAILWDTENHQVKEVVFDFPKDGIILDIAFSKTNLIAIAGNFANGSKEGVNLQVAGIKLFRINPLEEINLFTYEGLSPECLAFSPDSDLIAAGGIHFYEEDNRYRRANTGWILNAITGEKLFSFEDKIFHSSHGSGIKQVAFSTDGTIAIFSDHSGELFVVDVFNRQEITKFQAHRGHLFNAGFNPNRKLLATSGSDSVLRFWGVEK